MRKTTLKILSILSLALFIVFISCEKDLYDDAIHHHHKHANKISLKQFLNETGIKNFEKSIKVPIANADINARTANISDFNITTDSIYKLVNQENKTTYSFYIEPTSFTAAENEIFNLIYLKSDNVWEHTIIGLEKTSVQSPNQPLYQNSELLYDSRMQSNVTNSRQVCITEVYIFHCTGTGQCRYGQCDMCSLCVDRTLTVDFCGGSGGGSNPTDGSSDNTGGGDGSNNNDPYDFTPNDGSTPFQETPCAKLKSNTTNKPSYMTNFNNLNDPAAYNYPYETGFAMRTYPNGTRYYGYLSPSSEGTSLKIPSGCLNYTHIHNNQIKTVNGNSIDVAVKMFSPADLYALLTLCQVACTNNGASSSDAFGVMISNEGIFALSLLGPYAHAVDFNEKWQEFEENYKERAKEILFDTSLDAEERKAALEKMFLQELKTLGLEDKVGLFEGTVTTEAGVKKLNWTRKALDSNTVVENPC